MNKWIRKNLLKISRNLNIKVRFKILSKYSGMAYAPDSSIIVDPYRNNLFEAFFHEIGHVLDYRNNIYKRYNSCKSSIKYARKYSLRAEIHADETGRKLCKKYYPKHHYKKSYRNASDRQFLKEYIDSWKKD